MRSAGNWKRAALNTDADGSAKTVCAGYYKYGVQTLLTGEYGTTGTIILEYDAGRVMQDNQGAIL